VRPALFVPNQDVPQVGVVAEDVVERQDDAAGIAEEKVDALADQRFANGVCPDPGTLPDGRLVEHRLARGLDGQGFRTAVVGNV
jgi:hypothetical protein